MAYHATPTLSFRLPLPSFAVVETDDIGHATGVIRSGGCAHVSTRELTVVCAHPSRAAITPELLTRGRRPTLSLSATRTSRTMSSIFLSVSIMS